MTNNIIEVSGTSLFEGLYALFVDFLVPWLVIMTAVWGVRLIVKVFKRVGGS